MIIVRSPLRITLGGGGTDLPSYYRKRGGLVLTAAIDRYVYITVHKTFVPELIVRYSRLERVRKLSDLRHPIVREALRSEGLSGRRLEIVSLADIPAGTGLGSSGSFTAGLVKALWELSGRRGGPRELAEAACRIEIDRCREPIGRQDQFATAFGGLRAFEFDRGGRVRVGALRIKPAVRAALEKGLALYFTGYTRQASAILKEQDAQSRLSSAKVLDSLDAVKDIARRTRAVLEAGDLAGFARLLNAHWLNKRRRSGRISNPNIDAWYALARRNGALGGKLVGAGGGGFLMFYAADRARLSRAMARAGLDEVRFKFDHEGTKRII